MKQDQINESIYVDPNLSLDRVYKTTNNVTEREDIFTFSA